MNMECTYAERRERRCSLAEEVELGEAALEDWRALAPLHYRNHVIGGLKRLFALRRGGEVVGIIAYSLPGANVAARNRALAALVGRLPARGRVRFWNEHLRVISRVVVDPNWRGLGLAERLIRETLPQTGTAYVEALAAMGRVHPLFEKAGMTRYESAAPAGSERLREALATAGIGRGAARSGSSLRAAVEALADERLREWVAAELSRWSRSYLGAKTGRLWRPTLGQSCGYAARFLYSEAAYYLWANPSIVGHKRGLTGMAASGRA